MIVADHIDEVTADEAAAASAIVAAFNKERRGSMGNDQREESTPRRESTRLDLYTESEVAELALRFAVGDVVVCNLGSGKGKAEGVVVRTFYREREWTRGYYAAVRAPHKAPRLHTPALTRQNSCSSARSTKCS